MKKLLTASTLALLAVTAHATPRPWEYTDSVDKMTSKATSRAHLISSNDLTLQPPYSGGDNFGNLMVRKHPQHGLDVMVSIRKGQILCPGYTGCEVKIRFGDNQPVSFSALPPDDHSSTAVFLRNPQKFIDHAKKTDSVKVQLNVYNNGVQVLEFDSVGALVWGTQANKTKK